MIKRRKADCPCDQFNTTYFATIGTACGRSIDGSELLISQYQTRYKEGVRWVYICKRGKNNDAIYDIFKLGF